MKPHKKIILLVTAIGTLFVGSYFLNKSNILNGTKATSQSINLGNIILDDVPVADSLSASELESMSDSEVSNLFHYPVTNGTITIEKAYSMLSQLSTSKLSRVLVSIPNLALKKEYFTRLVRADFERAIKVILNVKESPYDIITQREGSRAAFLLRTMNNDSRKRILEKLNELDSSYCSNINSYYSILDGQGNQNKPHQVIRSVTKPKPNIHNRDYSVDDSTAIEVLQEEYAVTRADSERPVLQVGGVGPCVIVTLYDSANKIGAILHIDSMTDTYNSFDQIFAELRSIKNSRWEARIIGGVEGSSERVVYEIQDRINEERIPILEQDILHYSKESANIQLDTRTGKVTNFKPEFSRISSEELIKKFLERSGKVGKLYRSPDSLKL